ncbi:MAG: hypothetical protein JW828_00300, partial [Sedimentisphaerales bacterium]|nr:hypothetical protein [Sedimentisphaerales bacterium]
DVDLLRVEASLFDEANHFPWQVLRSGTGATLTGTTLAAVGSDFINRGVKAGHVIVLDDGISIRLCEIVEVMSASYLEISILRANGEQPKIAPGDGTGLAFRIATFDPQAWETLVDLTQHFDLRPGQPDSEYGFEEILAPGVLRQASVYGVLARVFAVWGSREGDGEAMWKKSMHYRGFYDKARLRCRLGLDLGDDGFGDMERRGGIIRLRRE